jgi:hypothetical protein
MLWFIILFLTATPVSKNHFCQCGSMSAKENIKKSDIILIGQVLNIDTLNIAPEAFIKAKWTTADSGSFTTGYLITMRLNKLFKGKSQTETIKVMTGTGNGDCGYYFKLRNNYLVYADKQEYYIIDSLNNESSKFKSHRIKYYTTTVCDRTTDSIKTESKLLIKALRNFNSKLTSLQKTDPF